MGPFKVRQCKAKYYNINKNGTPDNVHIDRLSAPYLQENPNYVEFPAERSGDTSLPTRTTSMIASGYDKTTLESENRFKTTLFERTVRL